MLPPMQLPVLELRAPGAENVVESLLPEGATTLDGAFADILQTRLPSEAIPGDGSALPLTGKDLPVLTPPDAERVVAAEPQPWDVSLDISTGWSDDAPPVADPRRQLLPAPTAGEPAPAPLDALTQPDAARAQEPAMPSGGQTTVVAARRPTVSGGHDGGDSLGTVVETLASDSGSHPVDAAAAAQDVPQGVATISPPIGAAIETQSRRAPPDVRVLRSTENGPLPRGTEAVEPRLAATIDADGERRTTPAVIGSEAAPRAVREEAPTALRPTAPGVPQPTTAGVEPAPAEVHARPAGDAPPSAMRVATSTPTPMPTPTPTPTLITMLDMPLQDPRWEQALSERIVVLANGRAHNAEIRLTPAELGPLRVQITIDDGTANVTFQAQHAMTREALEHAMPRLRDMLSESGLTLGQGSVSEQGVAKEGRDEGLNADTDVEAQADAAETGHVAADRGSAGRMRGDALVDTFA